MLKNSDTTIKADLRKKSSIMDEIEYSNYNIQACMVILVIMMVLLFINNLCCNCAKSQFSIIGFF